MQKQSKEEKELIAKLLQKTTLTKNEAEILYGKSELKNIDKQYNEDNTNTLNKEEKEAYINELFKDEIETEKELIELKNNDINTILKKIDAIQNINTTTISNEETHNIYNNLDVYFNNYLEYKKTYNKISNSSIKAYNASFKYLKYFTNKNTVFNFAFFKQVQQQMQQLPKNFFTHKNYKNMSYNEILKLKNIEKLNTKTINNHLNNMSSFFSYLEYEEIIKDNPLKKIKPLPESDEIVKLEYLKDELDTIFNNKNIEKEYLNMCKFALYTGLRLAEILSIKKTDIKDSFINLTLKSTSSKNHARIIPIHNNLIKVINYQKRNNKGSFLFFGGVKEINKIGKIINKRLKAIVNTKAKTFHSLRKNFSIEIELNTDAEESIKKYLMGHSTAKDITHTIYNRGKVNTTKLINCIQQITFNY